MSKLRIVHVVNFFDPRSGYAEYYLADKQQKKGHEVSVVTSDLLFSGVRRRSGFFNEEGVNVFRLPSLLQYSGNVLVRINPLRAILMNLSPDVVHLHDALSPLASMAFLCKDAVRCKIVGDVITGKVTAEGISLMLKTLMLKVYRMTFLPILSGKTDCFFVNSKASAEWIGDNLRIPHSRTRFVPLGADDELFCFQPHERDVIRRQMRISSGDVVAIYTGKLLWHKKIDMLLLAIAPLTKKHKSLKLLIVGGGPHEYVDYLKNMVHGLDISSNIIFHNQVHRTELRSLYCAADFAVWPGSPSISIIEAMSTSLPVIIAESKWTNHLLEYENGLSFTEGDVKALRTCIGSLLENNDLMRKMGKKGRELVEEKLNWNTIAARYLEVYEELVI